MKIRAHRKIRYAWEGAAFHFRLKGRDMNPLGQGNVGDPDYRAKIANIAVLANGYAD